MNKNHKKHKFKDGLVYSTNPDALQPDTFESDIQIPKALQNCRVSLEKKGRAGKTVTLIGGFKGSEAELEELAKSLKTKCGTGGSTKDGTIIIQGDFRQKVIMWLKEMGYSNTK